MRADGYGASIDVDAGSVRLIGGKMQSAAWGTETVTIPLSDVVKVAYRSANPVVNGSLRLFVKGDPMQYGDAQPNHVVANSLIVHFRRKDDAAFAAVRDHLQGITRS